MRSVEVAHEGPTTVIFDIGAVLYDWDPRFLYERLIPRGEALNAFLRDVVTREWHFQHDAGRPFAETSAELIASHPHHADLVAAWGERFLDTIPGPIPGMPELVDELDAAGVPLYAITNFSGEFFPPFREREAAMFDRFRDIVVSGDEKMVKPHAPIYRLALDRFGLRAEEAVFIDDNVANVAGAQAVGMTALHFTDAAKLRAELVSLGLLAPASRSQSGAPAPPR
ncbi:HAD family hydrolase [uncultured Sphingomonas sp.]|uniref:HAD family hydrolase n=1 Tax=uncultured Sphingomonas sp. TaxID=158754 RepID=UPI0035CB1E9C